MVRASLKQVFALWNTFKSISIQEIPVENFEKLLDSFTFYFNLVECNSDHLTAFLLYFDPNNNLALHNIRLPLV